MIPGSSGCREVNELQEEEWKGYGTTLSILTAPTCRVSKFAYLVTEMRDHVKLTRNFFESKE